VDNSGAKKAYAMKSEKKGKEETNLKINQLEPNKNNGVQPTYVQYIDVLTGLDWQYALALKTIF